LSAVWSLVGERAHATVDRVADVVLRRAVASLGAILAEETLGTFKLTTGARKAWRALATSVHLVALGSVVAEALVDTIRTKPS